MVLVALMVTHKLKEHRLRAARARAQLSRLNTQRAEDLSPRQRRSHKSSPGVATYSQMGQSRGSRLKIPFPILEGLILFLWAPQEGGQEILPLSRCINSGGIARWECKTRLLDK